jgi:hypothetical protein
MNNLLAIFYKFKHFTDLHETQLQSLPSNESIITDVLAIIRLIFLLK